MLDIKFIRENKDLVQAGAKKKHIDFNVDDLIVLDEKRRELLASIDKKRAEQNVYSDRIPKATDPTIRQSMIDEMKKVKDSLQKDEDKLKDILKDWQSLMVRVPNLPDMSVPEGATEDENQEIFSWGTKPEFSFTPKNHIEIMEEHDMADFERGAKIAGFRGYVLKNEGAMLNFAVWQFALNFFSARGYAPMMVPSLVNRQLLVGSGYLPQGEEDLYKTQDNTYLAGTGEVAGMGYHMDEVLDKKDLPKKILAFSPCFRREAGSHSKDTKGLIRVHEFFKFEQLILCEASHQLSVEFHEELTKNSEEFLQALNLPYRKLLICGGDLGLGQVKKYDLEAWVPSQNAYRETHSASYFHDFQTRRLNIRYRDEEGKMRFAHSLNNTAVAGPRILVSLVENNQQADGSILIPEALQPYMNGRSSIVKKI